MNTLRNLTRQKLLAIFLSVMGLGLLIAGLFTWTSSLRSRSRVDDVIARGYLRCGVSGELRGFSWIEDGTQPFANEPESYVDAQGIDADFCRAVAIALFGTAEKRVAFRDMNLVGRLDVVAAGEIDLMMHNTTWTWARDTGYAIDFGPVMFHDGQKIMTRKDTGIETISQLAGRKVCVLEDTTTLQNLKRINKVEQLDLDLITSSDGETWLTSSRISEVYFGGGDVCDAWSADASQLVAKLSNIKDSDRHVILPEILSHEPLAPVIPANDSRWHDVVNSAVWTTMWAEQLGVSQANVDSFDATSALEIQTFLTLNNQSSLGDQLGIQPDFAYQIVKQVGNYGEIYERHWGALIPERGDNQLYPKGRFQPPPF